MTTDNDRLEAFETLTPTALTSVHGGCSGNSPKKPQQTDTNNNGTIVRHGNCERGGCHTKSGKG
jgi:hypothetical protein